VNDVHELSTVIRGREMIAKPEDDKVPFPVHYLKDEDGVMKSTNSDLESLMQTLSGGSLTAPEAKKRTPVLDKIDKQAEEYENEADVVRATRMVELKVRESVEDFSGHAHQTGTFY